MRLIGIAAMSANKIMGDNGGLPWPHNKQDLGWFKNITEGSPIIMGSKTFDSLPFILPSRLHCVLSSNPREKRENVLYIRPLSTKERTIEYLLNSLESEGYLRAFLVGGAEVYKNYISYCDMFLLRTFNEEYTGDVTFPTELLIGRKRLLTETWNDSITELFI